MPSYNSTARMPFRTGGKVGSVAKKKYVPDTAKSAQHPHSKLKTQKELKKITDSSSYKKADYKGKTEMLGGKVYKSGGAVTRFRSSGPEGKPHSTKEGRSAEAQRAYIRKFGPQEPRRKRIWPKRAKHGIGGAIKKIISKIKPKPKGVPVKSVPKAVTDVDKPFKGYDKSYTRADDKKITSMLKKLGDEIKAQPLPPKLKETLKRAQKAYPHKKASGGRIGLKKGSVSKPGTHSWYLQHMNKNKKASGGRANFRHGGSVGAAVRGHGAEIK